MKLAVVIGQVVCTVRHSNLEHDRLLMVEMIGRDGKPNGECAIASDNIGAGDNEWVLVVAGSSARQTQYSQSSPVDLSVIGIVDEVVLENRVVFHK